MEPLISRERAAELLNKKASWLRYAERHRLIPFIRVGQQIRYRESDLEAWVAANCEGQRAASRSTGRSSTTAQTSVQSLLSSAVETFDATGDAVQLRGRLVELLGGDR